MLQTSQRPKKLQTCCRPARSISTPCRSAKWWVKWCYFWTTALSQVVQKH